MRVLHIITGLEDGGAEGVLVRLCLNDASASHHVISLGSAGKYGEYLRANGVGLDCLDLKTGPQKYLRIFECIRIIRRFRPDVVQTWMYHADLIGGILARFARVPKVFWGIRHGTLSREYTKFNTRFLMRLCVFFSYVIPDRIICCAESARKIHSDLGYRSSILSVVRNGYDLTKFKYAPDNGNNFRIKFGIDLNVFLVGMVARVDPQKDHGNFIDAAVILKKRIPSARFILVGVGTDSSPELSRLIFESGLESDFYRIGPRDDIPDVLNALDVHVLSSRGGEGFPNVVAEALACGTPSVATNVGDAFDIVGDMGWCVAPDSPEQIAEVLYNISKGSKIDTFEILTDHVKRKFSLSIMIDNFHKYWRN